MASNRVIGRDNAIPWKLPADLQQFKRLTWGHALVMGRSTFESIGRPLPGRTTIVLTRQEGYAPPGVLIARSLDEAIAGAGPGEVFIAGGADVYRQAIERAGRMYLTLIHQAFEGDAYFPEFEPETWQVVSQERHAGDGLEYSFLVYDRKA